MEEDLTRANSIRGEVIAAQNNKTSKTKKTNSKAEEWQDKFEAKQNRRGKEIKSNNQ